MDTILFIILVLVLAVVVFQDFKSKAISWFLIPILIIGFVIKGLLKIDTEELTTYFGINFFIVLINLIGVTFLVSLKERKVINILKTHLGLGDVLFFLVLTLAFSPINFVVFYLGSILLTTIIYGSIILFNKKKKTLIPLAGAMSLLLIITLLIEQLIPSFQFFHDIFQVV
ncbi:MAG: hypothetical protein A3K10_17265 [Bacteroidetes bacterium RIFCSPLOWO2_12_FULL_31_6]|nr:MAG: hypothetical protein A3K10_17265 [Bacteroidetes bacterium RIFCSPLOWO2_12_FULL_31_6]